MLEMVVPKRIELVERDCPVCGSGDCGRVFAEADFDLERLDRFAFASRKVPEYMHYRLIECPACDLLYANPIPSLELLASAYEEAAYDSGEEARFAARTYAGFLPGISARLPDLDGALDIGAGDGAFLEQLLDHGFTSVAGIEPSSAPIAAASVRVRPLIRQGLFRGSDFEAGRFSLVTCFQTLEHLYDPLAMLREAHALLKPGGAVLFIMHNRRSVSARALGLKSPIFDIEHLQLFSPASARNLLERCGFGEVKTMPVVNRYPLSYWLRLFPFPARMKQSIIVASRKTGVGRLPISAPVGNLAAVGFRSS